MTAIFVILSLLLGGAMGYVGHLLFKEKVAGGDRIPRRLHVFGGHQTGGDERFSELIDRHGYSAPVK
jgi:hypothetical protein